MTVRESGRDAVMVNCNPETVSTDYDTSDRLYFEPLTAEDVLAVIEVERPEGVIVQFGGQTPLKLAKPLQEAGVRLLGTPVDAIDLAEDRGRFGALLRRLGIAHPPYGTAHSAEEAAMIAEDVGFPLLVRPSYVLGGRAMEICYSPDGLAAYLERHVKADQEHPLLLDRFLEDAIEVDVDALADGETCAAAAIMQHVEEAGVHSGDSACVIPPMSLGEEMLDEIRATTERIALELGVVGLINIQYAVAGGELFVIEANPRASRTVPFVSKAIGAPLAKLACRLMLGEPLAGIELPTMHNGHVSVKEAVLPFARFAGADSVLGPEMKSTGEVMGIADDFPTAFGKAQAAAGVSLPAEGTVFITVTDADKAAATQLAARFHDLGFEIIATRGTAQAISRMGIPVRAINKIGEGSPHVVDYIRSRDVDMVINTPTGSGARSDGYEIRSAAVRQGIPCITTMTGASAATRAIAAARTGRGAGLAAGVARRVGARRSSLGTGAVTDGQRPAASAERRSRAGAVRQARMRGRRQRADRRLPAALRARSRGPRARARGSSTCSTGERWGSESGRPYLPRAFSVAAARRERGRSAPRLPARGASGPGRERSPRWRRARRCGSPDRSGARSRRPRELAPGAAGAILVGGGIGIAPLAILRRRLAERGVAQRTLLGFRDRAHSGGLELFDCSEIRLAYEDGHRGHRGYVTDLLAALLERRRRGGRRRLRLWPAGDAGGGASALRRARGVAAELAMEAPMACGFGSCFGCALPLADGGYMRLCVDGPVVRAEAIETALVAGSGH